MNFFSSKRFNKLKWMAVGIVSFILFSCTSVDFQDRSFLFFDAISKNDLAKAKDLRKGADVNKTYFGLYALDWAVINENQKAIDYLIKEGADVYVKDEYLGFSPLFFAIQQGNVRITEFFLKYKKMKDMRDKEGQTPLLWAVRLKQKELIPLLLKSGGSFYDEDNNKQNALFKAILTDDIDFFKDIRKKMPKANYLKAKDKTGNNLFQTAIIFGSTGMFDYLETSFDINYKNKDGETVLSLAINKSSVLTIGHILKHMPKINIQNNDGETVLMKAIKTENWPVIELILKQKPNLKLKDNQGLTAKDWAFKINNVAVNKHLGLIGVGSTFKLPDASVDKKKK